jgi:membrane protein DedA with SNARE-associated domain
VAYAVIVVADVLGDSMYYFLGRYWKKSVWIKKLVKFVGYDESSEAFLEEHFRNHKGKTFLLAKISHGIGGAVQVSSGIAGVKYSDFIKYSILGTVPKALILFLVGFYLGSNYVKIDSYFDSMAKITLTIVMLIFVYFIFAKYAKNYLTMNKDK